MCVPVIRVLYHVTMDTTGYIDVDVDIRRTTI